MNKLWLNNAGWVLAVAVAVSLAFASPTESSVMGRLPPIVAHKADRAAVALPSQLPAQRTLVLLTFNREQRADADAWIRGLQLRESSGMHWVRMPVVHDEGNAQARSEKEQRLFGYYDGRPDRSAVMAVFTDREAFMRQAGISSRDHVHAMVLNRDGEVLARAEGPYDPQRAEALRETLLEDQDDF